MLKEQDLKVNFKCIIHIDQVDQHQVDNMYLIMKIYNPKLILLNYNIFLI